MFKAGGKRVPQVGDTVKFVGDTQIVRLKDYVGTLQKTLYGAGNMFMLNGLPVALKEVEVIIPEEVDTTASKRLDADKVATAIKSKVHDVYAAEDTVGVSRASKAVNRVLLKLLADIESGKFDA